MVGGGGRKVSVTAQTPPRLCPLPPAADAAPRSLLHDSVTHQRGSMKAAALQINARQPRKGQLGESQVAVSTLTTPGGEATQATRSVEGPPPSMTTLLALMELGVTTPLPPRSCHTHPDFSRGLLTSKEPPGKVMTPVGAYHHSPLCQHTMGN